MYISCKICGKKGEVDSFLLYIYGQIVSFILYLFGICECVEDDNTRVQD